jgi:uncharacterized membrane protein
MQRKLVVALLMGLPTALLADLKVCNDTSTPVMFALERADNCDAETSGCDQYHVSGWTTVQPNACAVAFQGDASGYEFGLFAKAADGTTWGGDEEFCVEPNSNFNHDGILSEVTTCAAGKKRKFFNVLMRGESSDFAQHLKSPQNNLSTPH